MFDLALILTIFYWLGWLLRVLALLIIPANRKPTSSMAWLLVILIAPIPGWLLFLVIGGNKLPKSRRDLQKTLDHSLESQLKSLRREHEGISAVIDSQVPQKYSSLSRLARSLGRLPVFSRNQIKPLIKYDDVIDDIVSDIKNAQYTIYLEYYIFTYDETTRPIFTALEQAVGRGVVVRVLYDYYGSHMHRGYKDMKQKLAAYGVLTHPILPFRLPGKNYVRPDLRNHRKLVVIDNSIGYTGSQNLISRTYHRKDDIVYNEMVVRVVGPIASQLSAVFATDWFSETGAPIDDAGQEFDHTVIDEQEAGLLQFVPSGPGYDDENNLKLFTHSMYIAQSSITIINPYFVPTDALMTAIISATRRGVRVKMINSEAIDQWLVAHAQRSYYEELLVAGVEIYLYKKPTLLHSKFMIIDNEVTLIGSSNFDIRSFELNHELTLVSYNETFAGKMNHIAVQYLKRSERVTLSGWRMRHPLKRMLDNLARLTSALQ